MPCTSCPPVAASRYRHARRTVCWWRAWRTTAPAFLPSCARGYSIRSSRAARAATVTVSPSCSSSCRRITPRSMQPRVNGAVPVSVFASIPAEVMLMAAHRILVDDDEAKMRRVLEMATVELAVTRALALGAMQRENRYLRDEAAKGWGEFIGHSAAMQQLYDLIRQVAPARSSVLISGKTGKFELAGGGTVFLDVITEMPLALQAKLLRVLQEGEVERLGAQRAVKVELRIVAATNRIPQKAVVDGALRQDLYFRLNVVQVEVPPLRERRDDIVVLAEHFLQKYSSELGRPAPRLGDAALQYMLAYRWPGTVRDLENLMERAAVLCRGNVVDARQLPQDLVATVAAAPATTVAEPQSLLLRPQVEVLESRVIRAALARTGDNKSAASRLLGLSERALWYKLKKYGI